MINVAKIAVSIVTGAIPVTSMADVITPRVRATPMHRAVGGVIARARATGAPVAAS